MGQRPELLAIYLNDHLAGAMLGVEMARRLRDSNRGKPGFGAELAELCVEIEEDRATLERLMREMDIRRSTVKPAAAWLSEKLGRLKLNGQMRGYSPLSRLVELETLYIGITGKMQMWNALENTLEGSFREFDFAHLAERAFSQRARVQELHLAAAAIAFPATNAPAEEAAPTVDSQRSESLPFLRR